MPGYFEWFFKSQYPLTLYLVIAVIIAKFILAAHHKLQSNFLTIILCSTLFIPFILPWAPSFDYIKKIYTVEKKGTTIADIKKEASHSPNNFLSGSPQKTITKMDYLFFGWLTISSLMMLYLFLGYLYFSLFWCRQQNPVPPDLLKKFERLKKEVNIQTNIRLKITNDNLEPSAFGLFSPCIILPATLVEHFSWEDIRPIIIHEISHIKRGDLWVIFLQKVVKSIYFFHPFVWLTCYFLNHSIEIACDQQVINYEKDGLKYAKAIISFLELRLKPVYPMKRFALGYFGSIKQRIQQLVSQSYVKTRTIHKLSTGFIGFALFLSSLILWGEYNFLEAAIREYVKSEGPNKVYITKRVTYKIKINPEIQDKGEVIYIVPKIFRYISSTPKGIYNRERSEVQWKNIDFHTIKELQVHLQAIKRGKCVNTFKIRSASEEIYRYQTAKISGIAALHINSYDTEDPIMVGEKTVYVVAIRNEGTEEATNIRVKNIIPKETTLVKALGPTPYTYKDGVLIFKPYKSLAPAKILRYMIEVRAKKMGSAVNTTIFECDQFTGDIKDMEGTSIYK